ncbi:MAG: carbohydrate kinase family protein [Euryarchaeota archaeon]|nr:carbohydrate kinase family protein [Euryarchaeota archaeon]MDE1837589.1 carbohydrate kinase family protein [Euryarchaeota archaeon]MDE1881242.1 carbohydrate kinase family protein [Euryarchaeota archaeon]MDE2045900.1 carbohydrate kinase family protein [Thermoplasmata archaeon]
MPRGLPSDLDLLSVGHLNVDAEIRVPRLPDRDWTVPALARRMSLGGTAANIARWSAHLGVRTALSSFVGEDLPSAFLSTLRRDGVRVDDVVVRHREFTPTCWIFEDGKGGQLTIIDQGAMDSTRNEALPRRTIARSRLVHITTGDPVFQLRVARAAREAGKIVVCDPAQEIHYRWSPRGMAELLSLSEMFFGNEREFLQARSLVKARTPRDFLARVPVAVVTRGPKGVRAYTRRGTLEAPPARLRRFHRVTGAGDAFRGGFYRAWFEGEPLERCLSWGSAAAGALVEHPPGPDGRLPSRLAVRAKVPRAA